MEVLKTHDLRREVAALTGLALLYLLHRPVELVVILVLIVAWLARHTLVELVTVLATTAASAEDGVGLRCFVWVLFIKNK